MRDIYWTPGLYVHMYQVLRDNYCWLVLRGHDSWSCPVYAPKACAQHNLTGFLSVIFMSIFGHIFSRHKKVPNKCYHWQKGWKCDQHIFWAQYGVTKVQSLDNLWFATCGNTKYSQQVLWITVLRSRTISGGYGSTFFSALFGGKKQCWEKSAQKVLINNISWQKACSLCTPDQRSKHHTKDWFRLLSVSFSA